MSDSEVTWQRAEVTSPRFALPVPVIIAKDIPYVAGANRFQNLSIYLPETPDTARLIGTPADSLPESESLLPRYHVHIHGGARRDPQLTSASIEPTVANAFAAADEPWPIDGIVSLNYTISRFPTHPTLAYDPITDNHSDPAREAVHPQHVSDVLHGLALLRSFGLSDGSFILSGHSCGACLVFQAILEPPPYYGLDHLPEPPCPAALLGLNGLYDLPALVSDLGVSHGHLRDDYEMFLSNAFGTDKSTWPAASPARLAPADIAKRVREGKVPGLAVLDQSTEDQLVPMSQRDRLAAQLSTVSGLRVVEGHRCTGSHAAPWELGGMIWESIEDVLTLLRGMH